MQERDGKHGLPASTVFSQPEIEILNALGATLEGSTERQKNPHPPRSLAHTCCLDESDYAKGIKVEDAEVAAHNI